MVKRYSTVQCKTCAARFLCSRARDGRQIERSQYQQVIDENNKRVDANKEVYKIRQQISEHPFGTIKRGWGYSYTLLRGIKKVNAEMAIIFTIYNLRRAISILGVSELLKRLKKRRGIFCSFKTKLIRRLYSIKKLQWHQEHKTWTRFMKPCIFDTIVNWTSSFRTACCCVTHLYMQKPYRHSRDNCIA